MKKLDFTGIAARAADSIEAVCKHWLPGGKRTGHEWEIGDRFGNAGQSLKVHLSGTKAGQWADFAAGDSGGDLTSLVAYVEGCAQGEAAQKLAEFLGMDTGQARPERAAKNTPRRTPKNTPSDTPKPEAWRGILPVPEDAPAPPVAHIRHGAPDVVYTYKDAAGELLGYVARWEANDKRARKEFGWLVYAEKSGHRAWRWQGFPVPRPLYGLDRLAADQHAPVILCEGEKATDAACVLLPVHVALTWPGGGKAADKADFKPLQGRDVLLWPDADEAGQAAMQTAERLILKAGAASVRWLNLKSLEAMRNQGALPQGFDAADLHAEGWDVERIAAWLIRPDATLGSQTTPPPEHRATEQEDSRFTLNAAGLYLMKVSRDGESRPIRLCSPLKIPALARDEEGGGWAPVLMFRDRDNRPRQEIIPFSKFLGEGAEAARLLADLGLDVEPGREATDGLKQYILGTKTTKRARLVDSVGWHGDAFLLPEGSIGESSETLIYRGKRGHGVFSPRGTLAEWQKHVALFALGNPRLMFTLSVAFAGALLKPCGKPSSAFHWMGNSSQGKSGSLAAAASVWGNPQGIVHSWRHTDNALESTAAAHNDGLLILDELKEVDPKQAGAIAYMLANSKGKGRAHHAGGLRDVISWRIAMLSSGELGLADHMASVGQRAQAGQAVRFIELPVDAGMGWGMWNNLHQHTDGAAFTNHLIDAAAKYHGTASPAFIAALIENLDDVPQSVKRVEEAFMQHFVPQMAGVDGQVKRVAAAFATVAAAGELAVLWGICPWPHPTNFEREKGLNLSPFDAAGLMFKAWLNERPTMGNLEDTMILNHVRKLIDAHWQARFIDWHRASEDNADLSRMSQVHNALGFRKRAPEWTSDNQSYLFYVTRGMFEDEFATKGGFKRTRVAKLLKDRGILRTSEADNSTLKEQLPNGDPRSYCIIGRKLWAEDTHA
ncbi:MAG: hypothetical protein B7Y40_06015 [Gammaproteobacteria bacterium 28-57-27]|nr:MAG: hypothetical protein B7Y40_06015 [Gammaproteobacteria bacterium 28-57-27]